jgi:hypothetical protein
MNLYRYVGNSTPNYTDPMGLSAMGLIDFGVGANGWFGWLPSPSDLLGFIPGYGDAIDTGVCIYNGDYVLVAGAMVPGPNVWKYLKRLDHNYVKTLIKRGVLDPHDMKGGYGKGKDLFKDCRNGQVYVGQKSGKGEVQEVPGLIIRD